MQLNALLIADAVSAPPDGKFYIHGGGLTRLTVPVIPFPIPQLGVFVRLEIREDEVGEEHEFRFELADPDGDPVGLVPRFRAPLPAMPPEAPPLEPGEQRFVVLAVNLVGISVGRTGLHTLGFYVDNDRLGQVPLPVMKVELDELQATAPRGAIPAMPPRSPGSGASRDVR